VSLSRVLEGKSLFGALYGVYSLTLIELKSMLQHSMAKKGSNAAAAADATVTTTTTTTTAKDEGNF
jgi:hypothetical protein